MKKLLIFLIVAGCSTSKVEWKYPRLIICKVEGSKVYESQAYDFKELEERFMRGFDLASGIMENTNDKSKDILHMSCKHEYLEIKK